MAQPHAVIIGGGVGGLTAAVALHDRGWAVTVCEPSTSPGAVDTGLGILPTGYAYCAPSASVKPSTRPQPGRLRWNCAAPTAVSCCAWNRSG